MVDLTGLDIGDTVRMSAIQLPAGVEAAIHDRDFVIATIAGRGAEAEEAAGRGAKAAEGAAEG